jgi:hypothetical protein
MSAKLYSPFPKNVRHSKVTKVHILQNHRIVVPPAGFKSPTKKGYSSSLVSYISKKNFFFRFIKKIIYLVHTIDHMRLFFNESDNFLF